MESSSGGSACGKSSSSKLNGLAIPRKGVQKFYSKIRHKIEDSMPPKITARLTRNSPKTNLNPEPFKPIAPPRKQNQRKNEIQSKTVQSTSSQTKNTFPVPNQQNVLNEVIVNENKKISTHPAGLMDSDEEEECRKSLNDSIQSLEDEIFEELEKVAHDEAKLNAVLKNFDKILSDFTSGGPSQSVKQNSVAKPSENKICEKEIEKEVDPTISATCPNRKPLQKSKTCSIIESRCILKKSISNPTKTEQQQIQEFRDFSSTSKELPHFTAFQVTKSLWNLQDLEAFAKTGKKFDKLNCRLPLLTKSAQGHLQKQHKLTKSLSGPGGMLKHVKQVQQNSSIEITRPKSQLPRAISVLEISQVNNQHPACARTSSGSKIPIKKLTPQRLGANGRSASFCDQITLSPLSSLTSKTTNSLLSKSLSATPPSNKIPPTTTPGSSVKTIQSGKVVSSPKRYPGKMTAVNRIVRNLNEQNANVMTSKTNIKPKTTSVSPPSFINGSGTAKSITGNGLSTKKRRVIDPVTNSATLHSLNKIGNNMKVSTQHYNTLSSISSSSYLTSSLSANRSPPLKSSLSELSLNTLQIKEGTNESVNKVNSNTLNRKVTQQSDLLLNRCLEKGQEILKKVEAFGNAIKSDNNNQTGQLKANENLHIISKDVVDYACSPKVKSTHIVYATERTIDLPQLESCKIIPPLLCTPKQHHAELLVNVKTTQPPLRVHQDSMLCINSDLIRTEKDYNSDCSEDSGHISNENDELNFIKNEHNILDIGNVKESSSPSKKGTKITELLEKFESVSKDKNVPVPAQRQSKKACTLVKVAEVKPIKCITTSVEIYPTYSSEVKIQLH